MLPSLLVVVSVLSADCPLLPTSPVGCHTSTSTRCFMGDFTPETVSLTIAGCAKSQVTIYHPQTQMITFGQFFLTESAAW